MLKKLGERQQERFLGLLVEPGTSIYPRLVRYYLDGESYRHEVLIEEIPVFFDRERRNDFLKEVEFIIRKDYPKKEIWIDKFFLDDDDEAFDFSGCYDDEDSDFSGCYDDEDSDFYPGDKTDEFLYPNGEEF